MCWSNCFEAFSITGRVRKKGAPKTKDQVQLLFIQFMLQLALHQGCKMMISAPLILTGIHFMMLSQEFHFSSYERFLPLPLEPGHKTSPWATRHGQQGWRSRVLGFQSHLCGVSQVSLCMSYQVTPLSVMFCSGMVWIYCVQRICVHMLYKMLV